MEITEALSVVIIGMVVVFACLILLIACISIAGKIFTAIDNGKKNEIAEPVSKSVSNNSVAATDENEVIAAIAAAVAMMGALDNTTYKIKSIKAANNAPASRNVWALAGLKDSTTPF